MSYTGFALVRRHPFGGFCIVYGSIEASTTPEVNPDLHSPHLTLQHAVDEAAKEGFYSLHPEVYRKPTRIMGGM